MTTMNEEAEAAINACSDAVTKAVGPLLIEHDSRFIFACLAAEVAYLGALLRTAGVYQPATITRTFTEALMTALTMDTKTPKILYTNGDEKLGTKQ